MSESGPPIRYMYPIVFLDNFILPLPPWPVITLLPFTATRHRSDLDLRMRAASDTDFLWCGPVLYSLLQIMFYSAN
ncbi:hypothetical protein B0H13DRAFT_1993814 [Mycena leptocephala]|nr:hypothetical protein B0H13DRAFT_1993814 [Mycena leptocephala]